MEKNGFKNDWLCTVTDRRGQSVDNVKISRYTYTIALKWKKCIGSRFSHSCSCCRYNPPLVGALLQVGMLIKLGKKSNKTMQWTALFLKSTSKSNLCTNYRIGTLRAAIIASVSPTVVYAYGIYRRSLLIVSQWMHMRSLGRATIWQRTQHTLTVFLQDQNF